MLGRVAQQRSTSSSASLLRVLYAQTALPMRACMLMGICACQADNTGRALLIHSCGWPHLNGLVVTGSDDEIMVPWR